MKTDSHVVITGSNRGIGLALAKHYAQAGCDVTGICRQTSVELTEVANYVIDGIDLADDSGIAKIILKLQQRSIDLLLNVAGIMHWESLDEVDVELIRHQIEVNAIAPLRLTVALFDQLSQGAKVVFLTSRAGSIADNGMGHGYGYRMSKAALNMAAKTLAIDLMPKGIAIGILHPGSVKTPLNKLGGEIEVEEAVEGLTARIAELTLQNSGSFLHQNGTALPW
ncbi:MAG: SDR family oxidoreductase [Calothrix sp. MO_167.B42]|nr:SDR family oxidoreductase [Calothrix sp. MO_167.B42]